MGRQWLAVTGCVPRGRRKSRTGVFLDGLVRQRDTAGGRAYTEECFLVGQWYVCVYLRLDHATVDGKQRVGSVGGHPGHADPHCIYFGREARPYALISLLALVHAVVFWKLLVAAGRRSRHVLRTYRLGCPQLDVVLLTLYQHFDSAGRAPVLGHLTLPPSFGRAAYATSMADDLASIAIVCLLASPQLWFIGQRRYNWSLFVKPQGWMSLRTVFPVELYIAAPLVLAGILLVAAVSGKEPVSTRRVRYFWPLLACWYVVPVMTAWLLTQLGWVPLMFRRYVFIAVVPLFIHASLWGTLAMSRPRRLAYALAMLLLAGAYWLQMPRETWTVHSHEDWRSAVRTISADSASAAWPVLVRAGLIEDHQLDDRSSPAFREYCSFPVRGLYSLVGRPGPIVPLPSDNTAELSSATRHLFVSVPGVWFVYRGTVSNAYHVVREWQKLLSELDRQLSIVQQQHFTGVVVLQIRFLPRDFASGLDYRASSIPTATPFFGWQNLQAGRPPARQDCVNEFEWQPFLAHLLRQPMMIVSHRHELNAQAASWAEF